MATAQVTEDRLFTDALSYALSRVGLSSIALKQEQLTAIRYLYQRKDVFLWLPTGFGKSVCYEVLPFLFDFAGSKSGSIVLVLSPLVNFFAGGCTFLVYVLGALASLHL